MTNGWQPLPADVAEWMGMDEAMVPFALELADCDESSSATPSALDQDVVPATRSSSRVSSS